MGLSDRDVSDLRRAVHLLENPTLAIRLTNLLGKPIEAIGDRLPAATSRVISEATTAALERALQVALVTMENEPQNASELCHRLLALASGAVGGATGLFALPIELPILTVLMLRAIADIARSEGEDLRDLWTSLACMEVFALGARSRDESAASGSYFAMRRLLAMSIANAATCITERGIAKEGTPAVARFIAQVGARYGVVVTDKVAALAAPFMGALGGATINYAFINHYQATARGHFIVRRLERTNGRAIVRRAYARLCEEAIIPPN
jgi:hypothetical protein